MINLLVENNNSNWDKIFSFVFDIFWSYKENKGFIKIRKKIPLIYWIK